MHTIETSNGCEPEIMGGSGGKRGREGEKEEYTRTHTRVDNFIKIKRM